MPLGEVVVPVSPRRETHAIVRRHPTASERFTSDRDEGITMRHLSRGHGLVTLTVMLAVLGGGISRAETSPNASEDPQPATEQQPEAATAPPVSEEITVTAPRFERTSALTPKSVSVVTEAETAARPMNNIQGTIDDVPGIAVARGGGLPGQVVVRGPSQAA